MRFLYAILFQYKNNKNWKREGLYYFLRVPISHFPNSDANKCLEVIKWPISLHSQKSRVGLNHVLKKHGVWFLVVDILVDVLFAVEVINAVDVVVPAVPGTIDAPAQTPQRGILLPRGQSGVYVVHFV